MKNKNCFWFVLLFPLVSTAQFNTPKIVPSSKPDLASKGIEVFTWGAVAGYPVYTDVTKGANVSANPCASNRGYIVAGEKSFKNNSSDDALDPVFIGLARKTALHIHDYCNGKIWGSGQRKDDPQVLQKGFQIAWHTPKEMRFVIDTRGGSDSDLPAYYVKFEDFPHSIVSQTKTNKESQQKSDEFARKQAQYQAQLPRLEANTARLNDWFKRYKIDEFVSIGKINKNPFAYQGKTILTIGRFNTALNTSEILMREARIGSDYSSADLVISATNAAQWNDSGYLLVIKVNGRYEGKANGNAVATVLEQYDCKELNCRSSLFIAVPETLDSKFFDYGAKP